MLFGKLFSCYFTPVMTEATENMEEIWKDIAGFEGYYQVSNLGRVKSLKRRQRRIADRILVPWDNSLGYLICDLRRPNVSRLSAKIHRLVAMAFIPNPENKPQVNHKDADKHNNKVENLEWVTARENLLHSIKHHKRSYAGEKALSSKLTEKQVLEIIAIKRIKRKPRYIEIAKKYGVSYGAISAIRQGRNWKHLKR